MCRHDEGRCIEAASHLADVLTDGGDRVLGGRRGEGSMATKHMLGHVADKLTQTCQCDPSLKHILRLAHLGVLRHDLKRVLGSRTLQQGGEAAHLQQQRRAGNLTLLPK